MPFLLWIPLLRRLLVPRALRPFKTGQDTLENLYRAIAATTGATLIVDSSKSPAYGYLLAQRPGIDLHVVHLVRDARSNVDSTLRRPDKRLPVLTRIDNVVTRSIAWTLWHVAIELLWSRRPGRYLRVRYEDFAHDPGAEIARILDFADETVTLQPLTGMDAVLSGNHSVYGNPRQVRNGVVHVELDGSSQGRMRRRDRALVNALTLPMQRRYYGKPGRRSEAG